MKKEKPLAFVRLGKGGREILAACAKAGIDPAEALHHEIARRSKKLADKPKKSRKTAGKKNFARGGCNIRDSIR